MRFGNWYEMVVIYFWVVAVFFSLLSLVYFLFTALLVFLLLLLLLLHLLSSRVNSFFSSAWYAGKKKLEVGSVYVVRESGNEIPLQKIFFSFVHRYTHIFSLSSTLLLSHYLFFLFLFLSLLLFVCLFVCLWVYFFFFFHLLWKIFLVSIYIYTLLRIYTIYYIGGYYSSFRLFERVFCYTIWLFRLEILKLWITSNNNIIIRDIWVYSIMI